MKKLLLFSFAVYCTVAKAQLPFPTIDSLDINNIGASVLVHGDMWWSAGTDYMPRCTFPKGSARNVGFASAIWMSGYDDVGQLHVSAQTYRQAGNDYWPGPLDNNDTLTYKDSYYWAKIWKVNRTDIQEFQALRKHTKDNTPNAILTWPGKGNVNAKGNGGNPLIISTEMAPFIDANGNGIYEPLSGDYPDIKGDQALWWVFSDNGPAHDQTHGKPFGMEVHAMSYGYRRGTLIDNVVYYEYTFINKSANTYNNFRAGLHCDLDLGFTYDDFIGYDEGHRMAIQYNATDDDGVTSGHPVNSYGGIPPMVGVSLVSLPGDARPSYVPAGSFTSFDNTLTITGSPTRDTACNNYMRSKLSKGQHVTNDYTGPGKGSVGYGSGPECNYLFTGDPSDKAQWSECSAGNNIGDRRFVLSSNDLTLAPGSAQKIVIALIAIDSARGCPFTNFTGIKIAADTAWAVYTNPPAPKPVGVENAIGGEVITIYPNPAHDKLYIENSGSNGGIETIAIRNVLGQKMDVATNKSGRICTIDVSQLPAGFYSVLYRNDNTQQVTKFVKE